MERRLAGELAFHPADIRLELAAVKINHLADPLVSEAFEVASQGAVASLCLAGEPDVLRLKYYSCKYEDLSDSGEPYFG